MEDVSGSGGLAGLGCRVPRVQGSEFRVLRVQGSGFRFGV